MAIIACSDRSFPRDLDVDVQVSKPQVELETDLSVPVFVTKDAPFSHGADRIRYYESVEAVEADFATTQEAAKAAVFHFSQSPRAKTFAVAKAFTSDQAGFMVGGDMGDILNFQAVADGSFTIEIDGVSQDVTGLDFTAAADLDAVAAIIDTGLGAGATAVNDGGRIKIISATTGNGSTVSFLTPVSPATGTDISGPTFLNALQGVASVTDGYTVTDITQELSLIEQAADCAGKFVYGWTLDKTFRDTADQELASGWVQARVAIMALVSNSVSAKDPAFTTDIGSKISASGDYRTFVFWSDQPDEYPDVAALAYALHVNYNAENSTITMKFKDLLGITPAAIDLTDLTALQTKRYNVLTRVGNNARTFRDGVQAHPSWYIDDLINLDNYKEQLQTEVYNVLLREKKVPYTEAGVALIEDAIRKISELYVLNGTFAARRVEDNTRPAGFRIDPAYTITFTPLELISAADRAARIGPPFTVNANLAGAIHEVAINVNAFS
jgi:hypothetical protein